MEDEPKCKCGDPGETDHTCPYAEDIHDDHESLCNCCQECTGNCAMDIQEEFVFPEWFVYTVAEAEKS